MKDRHLLEKRLSHVVTCVEELRSRAKPDAIDTDPVQRAFVLHTLQTAIQGILDVASFVVSDRRLGEPATNRDLLRRLAEDGAYSAEKAVIYGNMAGFRNVVVHSYLTVDLAIVRSILRDHLADLSAFVSSIRDRYLTE